MKIVIAPDKFKGSLTAAEACDAIERGVRRVLPRARIVKLPLADGGEGTVRALVSATSGKLVTRRVTGPLGGKVSATFGLLGDGRTAVIEMAAASGLVLVPERKRNPLITTTYGTGELIAAALELGARRILIGIGGSATNDGGAGMAMALGARLLDRSGRNIGFGGGELRKLDRVDFRRFSVLGSRFSVLVACDVFNPLCGPNGASAVYGPQKGATPAMVKLLDRNLAHYAKIVERDVPVRPTLPRLPGAGAAGGLGYGLCAFLGAKLQRGIELVLDHLDFESHLRGADLVITGEGAVDEQTLHGKVPMGVARRARKFGVPVIALGGSVPPSASALFGHGIDGLLSVCHSPMTLSEAMQNAASLLELCAERAMRVWRVGSQLRA
jgi:glycerate kinase